MEESTALHLQARVPLWTLIDSRKIKERRQTQRRRPDPGNNRFDAL